MQSYRIPVFKPWMTDLEVDAVSGAIRGGNPTLGEDVSRFAGMLAKEVGVEHVLLTCNGTAACFLAVAAHQFPQGSEIIVPEITFIATANACRWAGCIPVPADVDRETWCMDPEAVLSALTPRTVAVMPVHLYGVMCDMGRLEDLCFREGLVIIEDACEALGSRFAGGWGSTAAFSFYGNKTITTGEGGAFATNDKTLMERAEKLWGQGQTGVYVHPEMAYNLRMPNLNAALGCTQMSRLDEIKRGKVAVAKWYAEGLSLGQRQLIDDGDIPWATARLFADPRAIAKHLHDFGIDTRPVFPPISSQRQYCGNKHGERAALVAQHGLVLPSYAQMTRGDFEYIMKAFDELPGDVGSAEENFVLPF